MVAIKYLVLSLGFGFQEIQRRPLFCKSIYSNRADIQKDKFNKWIFASNRGLFFLKRMTKIGGMHESDYSRNTKKDVCFLRVIGDP